MQEGCQVCKYANVSEYGFPCDRCSYNQFAVKQENRFEPIETGDYTNPNYYKGEIECIDAMIQTQGIEAVKNFCICNAFKYVWRWKQKGGVKDLRKALQYIDKFVELEEKKDET